MIAESVMSVDTRSVAYAWFKTARRPDIVRRSAKVSFLVGTILVGINQGNLLFDGTLAPELFWKIPLTYCVPYAVSSYAAVDAILSSEASHDHKV